MYFHLTLNKISGFILLIFVLAATGCKHKKTITADGDNILVSVPKEGVDISAYPTFIAMVREANGKKINDPLALKKHFIRTISVGIPTF